MANASDTMRYLMNSYETAQAGTSDEGQAAEALSRVFNNHGLESVVMSFRYDPFATVGRAFLGIVVALAGIVGGIARGPLPIVMLVLAIIAVALYVLETRGIKTISRLGRPHTSQNVIARHPGRQTENKNQRPIVIVAHYDTPCADILANPALKRFRPYLLTAVHASAIAIVVCLFLEALPVPTVLHSILWAIAIVASLIILVWGVAEVLHTFVLPSTHGANDNRSGVAALIGLLDRVRPYTGSAYPAPGRSDRADDATGVGEPAQRRSSADYDGRDYDMGETSAPSRRSAPGAVRHGEEVIRSLGIIPPTCELVYETAAPAADERASAAVSAARPAVNLPVEPPAYLTGMIHLASEENAVQDERVIKGETMLIDPSQAAAEQAAPVQQHEVLDTEEAKDKAADEIMAGIVGGNPMTGFDPDATSAAPAPLEAQSPEITGMLSMPAGQVPPAAVPSVAPAVSSSFQVITSTDAPDVELRHASLSLPLDVADQSASAAVTTFFNDEPSPMTSAVVSSDEWGTSSFTPVAANRRILRDDVPDPAVAAVDPFSVNSVETAGEFNPEDFSQLDFETGTHSAVTPAMLEEVQRRNLDGFSPEFTEHGSKRHGRKNKRGRTGRISHQAAQMQAEMEEQSFTDWMGLDENFDAKTSGRQIGSWENFGDDGQNPQNPQYPQYPQNPQNPNWQGGAARNRRSYRTSAVSDEDRELRQAAMTMGDEALAAREIWFVFSGASDLGHNGIKEFLAAYNKELRGAYLINLECVGLGNPCLLIEEGEINHAKADRRLVNLFGAASAAINRPLGLARLNWRDTEASDALRQNHRAVTVCGMDREVPANSRWQGDMPDKLNFGQIDDIVDIMAEVIKNS